MDTPHQRTDDALFRHAGALRALARGLLGEEHAAEDAVQDTWVRALERPPRRVADGADGEGQRGGWLRSVTRSIALNRRRTEVRRTQREQRASRHESSASTDEVVEKRQVLKSVIDAVLELEEPYQTVVVMRYYEDLPPREIAARRGVPVATVKSQLHRGLARLRERLDDQAGGERTQWASALAVTLGWQSGGGAAPVQETRATPRSGRDVVMIGKTIAAIGAVSLMTVAAVRWTAEPEGAEVQAPVPSAPALAALSEPDEGGVMALEAPERGVAQRVAQGETTAPAVESSGPEAAEGVFVVSGIVVDENDAPAAGARILVGPPAHPLNVLDTTDENGAFEARWTGTGAQMEVVFSVHRSEGWSGLHRLTVDAGRERTLHVMVPNAETVLVRSVVSELTAIETGAAAGSVELARIKERAVLTTDVFDRAPEGFFRDLGLLPRWDGGFRWNPSEPQEKHFGRIQLIETVSGAEDTPQARVAFKHELHLRELEVARKRHQETLDEGARVVGRVTDALGAPVAFARVQGFAGTNRVSTRTAKDGTYTLGGLEPGAPVLLRAGGDDFGVASTELAGVEGEQVWDAVLDRGLEVRGRLVDASGEPLKDWLVEIVVADGTTTYDRTATSADGSFAIPNAPRGTLRLFARPIAVWEPLPAIVFEDVSAGGAELEFEVPDDSRVLGGVAVALETPSGTPVEGADVVLWQESTGRGVWLARGDEPGTFASRNLPSGSYRVTAGSRTHGYRDLGSVWVDGEMADLGVRTLDAPARVALDAPTSDPAVLVRLGSGFETVMGSWPRAEAPTELELPVGDYAWQSAGN